MKFEISKSDIFNCLNSNVINYKKTLKSIINIYTNNINKQPRKAPNNYIYILK